MKRLLFIPFLILLLASQGFAAVNFDGGAESLQTSTPVVTVADIPWSVCAWARSENDTSNKMIFSVALSSADTDSFEMQAAGSVASDPVRFFIKRSTDIHTATTTGFTINTYFYACIVEAASDDHKVYINGNSVGSSTTSKVPVSLDLTRLGNRAGTSSAPFDGDIAEVAVWHGVALTQTQINNLYSNAYPANCEEPTALTYYWPLADVDDLTDKVSSDVLSINGTPTSNTHPTINPCDLTVGTLDAFTDTNGVNLEPHNANWLDVGGAKAEVQSNVATLETAATDALYHWNRIMPSADGKPCMDVTAIGAGTAPYAGIRGRATTNVAATADGYDLNVDLSSGGNETITLYSITNGAIDGTLDTLTENFSVPFTLCLNMSGTTITGTVDGVTKVSHDISGDTPKYESAGYVGFFMGASAGGTDLTIDNFIYATADAGASATNRPVTRFLMNYIEPEGLSIWQSIKRAVHSVW